jgi:hypothetical protein
MSCSDCTFALPESFVCRGNWVTIPVVSLAAQHNLAKGQERKRNMINFTFFVSVIRTHSNFAQIERLTHKCTFVIVEYKLRMQLLYTLSKDAGRAIVKLKRENNINEIIC